MQRGFEVGETGHCRTARLMDLRPGSPIEIPKSSVMRFEISAETSHSVAGGISAVFDHWIVGNDSSSATQGRRWRALRERSARRRSNGRTLPIGEAANSSASANTRQAINCRTWQFSIRQRNDGPPSKPAAATSRARGGARERWDFVGTRAGERQHRRGRGSKTTATMPAPRLPAGGGSAAIGIRQPTQQQSIQILLLSPSFNGVGCPARPWWQIAPNGFVAISPATRAAPKLASKARQRDDVSGRERDDARRQMCLPLC